MNALLTLLLTQLLRGYIALPSMPWFCSPEVCAAVHDRPDWQNEIPFARPAEAEQQSPHLPTTKLRVKRVVF